MGFILDRLRVLYFPTVRFYFGLPPFEQYSFLNKPGETADFRLLHIVFLKKDGLQDEKWDNVCATPPTWPCFYVCHLGPGCGGRVDFLVWTLIELV
jgi:hypothetical protein